MYQVSEAGRAHSFHNAMPVNLDRVFAEPQLGGGLLIEPAGDDAGHDLALPRRELRHPAAYFAHFGPSHPGGGIALQRLPDGVQQILVTEGFGQKVDCALFHGLDGHRDIAMRRNEDYGDLPLRADQLALQVKPTQAGHAYVQDQARRTVAIAATQKFLGRREALDRQAYGCNQAGERLADGNVVVNNEYNLFCQLHCASALAVGNLSWNVAPGPLLRVAHSRPPCVSTMERLIANPIPIPLGLVVKKGSKTRSRTS